MPNLGPTELIIILVIVLAIFGAGRLGTLGGALGRGVRDFRKAIHDDDKEAASKATPNAEDESDSGEAEA